MSAETSTSRAGRSLEELQELERRYAIPTYARNPVQFVRGSGCRFQPNVRSVS